MKLKTISLIALSLGVSAVSLATEYRSPEFNEDYKVEGAVRTERGIASEEESDREPSSVVTTEKKKVEQEEEKVAPQPWLFQKPKSKVDY